MSVDMLKNILSVYLWPSSLKCILRFSGYSVVFAGLENLDQNHYFQINQNIAHNSFLLSNCITFVFWEIRIISWIPFQPIRLTVSVISSSTEVTDWLKQKSGYAHWLARIRSSKFGWHQISLRSPDLWSSKFRFLKFWFSKFVSDYFEVLISIFEISDFSKFWILKSNWFRTSDRKLTVGSLSLRLKSTVYTMGRNNKGNKQPSPSKAASEAKDEPVETVSSDSVAPASPLENGMLDYMIVQLCGWTDENHPIPLTIKHNYIEDITSLMCLSDDQLADLKYPGSRNSEIPLPLGLTIRLRNVRDYAQVIL